MLPNRVINFGNKLLHSVLSDPPTACFKNHLRNFVNNVDADFFFLYDLLRAYRLLSISICFFIGRQFVEVFLPRYSC